MSEICLDCLNKGRKKKEPAIKYILSKELDLCEGCGEMKHVVLISRAAYYRRKYRVVLFPFRLIYGMVFALFRLIAFPFTYRKQKEASLRREKLLKEIEEQLSGKSTNQTENM